MISQIARILGFNKHERTLADCGLCGGGCESVSDCFDRAMARVKAGAYWNGKAWVLPWVSEGNVSPLPSETLADEQAAKVSSSGYVGGCGGECVDWCKARSEGYADGRADERREWLNTGPPCQSAPAKKAGVSCYAFDALHERGVWRGGYEEPNRIPDNPADGDAIRLTSPQTLVWDKARGVWRLPISDPAPNCFTQTCQVFCKCLEQGLRTPEIEKAIADADGRRVEPLDYGGVHDCRAAARLAVELADTTKRALSDLDERVATIENARTSPACSGWLASRLPKSETSGALRSVRTS